jgi:predicted metal-dependent HD superfamily phosphohydrolase
MKEPAELFKRLAARHRQLARELHNDEVIAALLQLADECHEKAEELERRVAGDGANTSATFKAR